MERYTDELAESIKNDYLLEPTLDNVKALSEKYNRSTKSIIAKLSSMGVYKSIVRKTKDGRDIIKKEDLVKKIEEALGISAPSLIKTAKLDLRALEEAISERIFDNT